MTIQALDESSFDEVIAKHDFVVVDFWAQWCGPCKSFSTIIESIEAQYPQVLFAAVDIEKESALAEEFSIRSVPAVMILRYQTVVYADSGALSAASLKELLDKAAKLSPQDLNQDIS